MKKILLIITLMSTLFLASSSMALQIPGAKSTIYNENINEAINTDNIDDPLRDGSYMIIDNEKTRESNDADLDVGGIVNIGEITEHNQAKESVLNIIKNIINYALGLAWLVALVYLLAHGFMIVTAAGDDAKYKKGLKGVKTAAIALIGIGVSFFIVSFIFYIIRIVIGGSAEVTQ